MKRILLFVISLSFVGFVLYKLNSSLLTNLKLKLSTQIQCIRVYKKTKQIPVNKTSNNNNILIYIPTNSSTDTILQILIKKNIIKAYNSKPFFCYLKKQGLIPQLQSGYFIIPPKTNLNNLATKLTKPEQAEISITLPEGLRKDQVTKILTKYLTTNNKFSKFDPNEFDKLINTPPKQLLEKYNFLPKNKPLEGFLFPDTYSFNRFTTTAEQALDKLLNTFQAKALPILNSKMKSQYQLSAYQKLILASIIERETNNNYTERQMVTDILLKRLSVNMPLQVDATLLYPKKDWTYILTYQDLHTDNPYNTYTRTGLPPTPICNPGLLSIKAVNNPIKNDYWFYMHDKLGNIHYSTTFSEHTYKVNKYIR